jgi:hypothetical protein
MKSGEYKDCSLAHSWYCLANNIFAIHSIRNTFLLHFRRIFKPKIINSSVKLIFQQKVFESHTMYTRILEFVFFVPWLYTWAFSSYRLSHSREIKSSKSLNSGILDFMFYIFTYLSEYFRVLWIFNQIWLVRFFKLTYMS